jgi:hypothetical protein
MTRPALPDFVRVVLFALGICCLFIPLYTLWEFRSFRTAEGTVVVYPAVDGWGRTNIATVVSFTAPDSSKAVVMASDIPAGLRTGDHFTVVYDPKRWLKDSWLLKDVLRPPVYATILSVALILLGALARSRRRVVFTKSHSNAA